MRLTAMTDYALRLLMYLGMNPDRLCTSAEIARAYDISEAHLNKITHQLGQQGWISTVRGKGGGMRLALAPEAIGLGALVRRVEPDFALVECLGAANACKLTGYCRLTGILNGALNDFLARLDRHTLADLLAPTGADVGLQALAPIQIRASSVSGRPKPPPRPAATPSAR